MKSMIENTMRNTMKSVMLVAGCTLFGGLTAPAFADDEGSGRYAAVSSFNWQIDSGKAGKGSGARLTLGQELGDYLGVEFHGALGGSDSNAKLNELLGGYLRASYPFNDYLSVYGLYGYTRAKVNDQTETGGSYGGGVEFKVLSGLLDGRLRLTADYIVYLDKRGGEFVAKSAGLRLDF